MYIIFYDKRDVALIRSRTLHSLDVFPFSSPLIRIRRSSPSPLPLARPVLFLELFVFSTSDCVSVGTRERGKKAEVSVTEGGKRGLRSRIWSRKKEQVTSTTGGQNVSQKSRSTADKSVGTHRQEAREKERGRREEQRETEEEQWAGKRREEMEEETKK